jgi:hypothetical protein
MVNEGVQITFDFFVEVVIAWKDVENIEKTTTFLGLFQNAILFKTKTMEVMH